MVFSSLIFICFFLPVVLFLYYIVPDIKHKNLVLILASLFFYAWGGSEYVLLLIGVVLINYFGGILIYKFSAWRSYILALGVLANVGILGYFKYAGFIVDNINKILNKAFILPNIVLPIGISFYVFQGLSYLIDVYRYYHGTNEFNDKLKGCEVQKNPLKLLLYISLFPQLIAGPIVRYKDISTQISKRKFSLEEIAGGIERFVVGLAKKVIIADNVGLVADNIFSLPGGQLATDIAWIGALCYSLQIYFDFMGYSDMAIGLAEMFGFKFQENFNYPYISKSISEFWRRWHISLSSWFRDYVYIPLGGSRKGNVYIHLLIVFFLTGVWHGAQWSFIAWGLWHGIFIIFEKWIQKKNIKFSVPVFIKWVYTTFIVILGWVLFRAHSFLDGLYYWKRMIGRGYFYFQPFGWRYYLNNKVIFIITIAILLSVFPMKKWIDELQNKKMGQVIIKIGSAVLLIICIVTIINSSYSPFIYFRF